MRRLVALALVLCAAAPLGADDLDKKIDAFFARFDLDRDGRIAPSELAAPDTFARLDRDADGYLTRSDLRLALPDGFYDESEQGSKGGDEKPEKPTTPAALQFALMMPVTAKSWERIKSLARSGDLFWGDVPTLPAKVKARVLDPAAPPAPADLIGCAAVFCDVRGGTAAQALETTRAAKTWLETANAANIKKSRSFKARPLVVHYTAEQLADEADLCRLADVVLLGEASWSLDTLKGGDSIKPAVHIGSIEKAGRQPGLSLGSTSEHPHDTASVEAMVRQIVAQKVTHVGFESGDDQLHSLLEALVRLR